MKKSTIAIAVIVAIVFIAVAAGCGMGFKKKPTKRNFRLSDPFRHLSLQVEAPRDITASAR